MQHTLFLHYACLGVGAKPSEVNIVTLSTQDANGEDLTLPIAWLSEHNPQVSMRLPVNPPVTLKLAQGNGPVAVGGVHEQVLDDIGLSDEEDGEEKEDMSSPEVVSKGAQELSRKRPAPSPAVASGKKDAKVMKKKAEDEEESDDEDDEDSGEELDKDEVIKYLKAKGLFNGGAGGDNEGESGDDDDDEDEDDEDEEDEDDDDEEDEDEGSEEEEMEQAPAPKKTQAVKKPVPQQKGKDTFQTPKQQKVKTPQLAKKGKEATPTTVKSASKGKPAPPSVDQLKARLLKSPNLPKKPEKFANFIKNTFKIDDANIQKQLWEFVQKSKK